MMRGILCPECRDALAAWWQYSGSAFVALIICLILLWVVLGIKGRESRG